MTYDGNQNLAGALGNSYVYDAANRLTSATIGGVGYAFGYDPQGRLSDNGTSTFQYAGLQLVGEYDGTGTLTIRL